MSKINIPTVSGGFNLSQINSNFDQIEQHLNDRVLYRDVPTGEPNQMVNDLDMNSYRIYNLPEPVQDHEPLRKVDADKILDIPKVFHFQPPVIYTEGLNITNGTFTVDYQGVIYYPRPSFIPFTTGTWNPAQWSPVQNTNPGNELLVFEDYATASTAAATLPDGQVVEAEDKRYVVSSGALQFVSNLNQLREDLSQSDGVALVGGAVSEDALTLQLQQAVKRSGMHSRFAQGLGVTSVLMVGDSNSAGNGATLGTYRGSLMGRFARALMNAFDNPLATDRGFMFETWLNPYQQMQGEPGWSRSGGSFIAGGNASGTVLRMQSGDYVEKTGVEVAQGRVYFVPATSSGSMTVTVDGVTATNITDFSAGYSSTFSLAPGGAYINPASKVRFTCTSGTIDVTGFRLIRAGGSSGPLVFCSPEGSQGFADYYSETRASTLTSYVKADATTLPVLVVALLGTNNMISAVGKQLSPSSYVAAMQTFMDVYSSKMPGCTFAFWVPPKPDVTLPLATYEEYVKAIVAFAETQPTVTLIRMDQSGVQGAAVYNPTDPVPGVHFNDAGHAAVAQALCGYFGITPNTALPSFAKGGTYAAEAIAGWTVDLTALAGAKTVQLYGRVDKVSGTADFATLPVAVRPAGNLSMNVTDHAGVARAVKIIGSTGIVSLANPADVSSVLALFFTGQGYMI